MTEIIGPRALRTTRWADAIAWLKDGGVDPSPVARGCSRNNGRHRVGFRATVTVTSYDEYLYRLHWSNDVVTFDKVPDQEAKNFIVNARRNPAAGKANHVGRKAHHVAVYTARTTTKGAVEFRIAYHETIVTAVTDALAADHLAPSLVHIGYPSHAWDTLREDLINGDLKNVRTVIPWITDYRAAGRMAVVDTDEWLESEKYLTDAPKYVKDAAAAVLARVSQEINSQVIKDTRL